jgi:hypothetical protein
MDSIVQLALEKAVRNCQPLQRFHQLVLTSFFVFLVGNKMGVGCFLEQCHFFTVDLAFFLLGWADSPFHRRRRLWLQTSLVFVMLLNFVVHTWSVDGCIDD